MNLTNDAEKAHDEGRLAYVEGVEIDSCPYPADSTAGYVWRWAWMKAWDEEAGTE